MAHVLAYRYGCSVAQKKKKKGSGTAGYRKAVPVTVFLIGKATSCEFLVLKLQAR